MGCYYALLLFGKDVCFREINLDSSICKQQYLLSQAYKEQLDLDSFPTDKLAISYGKSWSINMEWSFHESQSNAGKRLLRPGTSTACSIYNSDIVQRRYSSWAGTQINVASLSLPEFYSECHDIFHRNSKVSWNSANMTEGLLCAKYSGRSWRYCCESHSILAHKSSLTDNSDG